MLGLVQKNSCLELKKLASGLATACCSLIAQDLRSPAHPSEMQTTGSLAP